MLALARAVDRARHMIVDRVQQGSMQIEEDCRGGQIFSGEILWENIFSGYHTIGFRPALHARSSGRAAKRSE
jgi:hypothetical protein